MLEGIGSALDTQIIETAQHLEHRHNMLHSCMLVSKS